MELEFHQLDLRYERLRVQQRARERRLLASLADAGQQMPIVVVTAGVMYVVVDGHKRVRCLRRLQRDTVAAVIWEMAEAEALIFRQLLHTDAPNSALEHGWLLRTLHEDHGLSLEHLARRFDRSVSWVSRRLSLVRTLPVSIQQHVRDGQLAAHAAMKYCVPLARANEADCVRLVEAIVPHRLTTRQVGRLYQLYVAGPDATRALVIADPRLVLRLTEDTPTAVVRPDASAPEALIADLHILGAVARSRRGTVALPDRSTVRTVARESCRARAICRIPWPLEEQILAQADPPVPAYAAALKQRSAGRGTLALRRLLALYREYPRAPVQQAVTLAAQYGLFDLDRVERLILRVIAKDYFRLGADDQEPDV